MRTIDQLLGHKDFLTDGRDFEPRTRKLTDRPGREILLIPHHSVSPTLGRIDAEFKSPYRTLSATAGVGPLTAGVDNYIAKQYVRWNESRPYTTASDVDDRAITFEMANLEMYYPWKVGDTGKRWIAELAAAMHVELGMPLDRDHVLCHSEVWERGMGSYATQCCGDDLRGDLDEIVALAKKIVADEFAAPTEKRKQNMSTLFVTTQDDKRPGTAGATGKVEKWALAGDGDGEAAWLEITDGALANDLANTHGRHVWLTKSTFANWKAKYLPARSVA